MFFTTKTTKLIISCGLSFKRSASSAFEGTFRCPNRPVSFQSRAAAFLLSSIVVLALAACAPRSQLAPLALNGQPAPAELRTDLFERSLARLGLVKTARASYEALFPSLSPQPLRAALLVDKLSLGLRIEFLPPTLATSLLLFVSHEYDSRLLLPPSRQAYLSGPNAAGILRSFIKIPLADADFGLLCLGILPRAAIDLIGDSRESTLSCDATECLLQATRSRDQWLLDRASGQLLAALLFDRFQQDPVIAVEFAYDPQPGDTTSNELATPSITRISYPKHQVLAELRLKKLTVNPPLNPELFHVAVPSRYATTSAPSLFRR